MAIVAIGNSTRAATAHAIAAQGVKMNDRRRQRRPMIANCIKTAAEESATAGLVFEGVEVHFVNQFAGALAERQNFGQR